MIDWNIYTLLSKKFYHDQRCSRYVDTRGPEGGLGLTSLADYYKPSKTYIMV